MLETGQYLALANRATSSSPVSLANHDTLPLQDSEQSHSHFNVERAAGEEQEVPRETPAVPPTLTGRRRRRSSTSSREQERETPGLESRHDSKRRRNKDYDMLGDSNGTARDGSNTHGKMPGSPSSQKPAKMTGNGSMNTTASSEIRSRQQTFYGHDREQVTRILIQGLSDMGYHNAAESLSRESGFDLETPFASAFRLAILTGDWTEAESLIQGAYDGARTGQEQDGDNPSRNGLLLAEDASMREMLFAISEQKYLELLEARDLGAALLVLREELQPLQQDERQLHALSRHVSLRKGRHV